MLSQTIILQSAGSLSVAVLALLMVILQTLFFFRKPQFTWYAWSAASAFTALLYSIGIFLEYNTPEGPLNRFSGLLEYTAIICLVHCLYGFTFSYLGIESKRYHPIAGVCHGLILILLWSTNYIVSESFITRDFFGLESPYIEPALGPFGPVFVLYAAIAGVTAMTFWIKQKRTDPKHRIIFLAGIGFWLLLGIHDGLASLGLPTLQYFMEYGFLGFAMVVLWVVFNSYLEIAAEEKYRVITEFANDGIMVIQDGKMVFRNPACCDLVGGPLIDSEPRDFLDIMVSEDRKTVLKHYHTLLEGGYAPNPYTVPIRVVDREQRFVEIASSLIQYRNRPAVLAIMRDVTERKQAEKALRESEERLRIAGKAAYDLIYEWDVASDALEWFGDVDGLLGYRKGEISRDINAWLDLINPEDKVKLENAVELHKTSTEPIQYEYRVRHKDGTYRHWNDHGLPLIDDKGCPYKWVGVCTDITERKWAEEALRESEDKYRNLVNDTTDLFYRTDMEGKIIFVSPSVHRLSGYTAEEAIGMKMAKKVYASLEERAILLAKLQEDGCVENFEAQLKRKDGSIWWTSTNAHFFKDPDGNIKGVEGIIRDITLQKKSATALKESEARLKKAQSVAKIGNWEYDISTGEIWGSDEAFKIFGIERISPQLPLDKIAACIPDAQKIDKALIDLIQKNKKYDIHFEVHREVDGEAILIHSIAELVWEDGAPKKVLGVIQDVTEQKKAEKEREDLQSQLRRAQKMEAIGTLAGGVAHDLNNILGGLVSYPELLLVQIPKDSHLRKPILTIQKSGEKAAAVVQDLLTLARRGVVVTEVVNLNNVISEYLKSPGHEKLKSYHLGVHLEIHLEKDRLNILGSSTHLYKTVMNLVSNAAEAMPDGGKIAISTENRYIDRPISGYDDVKEGDYLVLTISDTGTGIPPEDIEKIFEPFYTKKKMGRSGTGLGMAVVWGTVKDHNGYIDVQSTEGEGTTFTLYFPVTRKELPEDKSRLAIESYSGTGESILIVDDVEEQRQIASGMLQELGYSVVSVSSGEEAVEYLRTNKVDLLLLDMIMDPGMDGLDTYKKILKLHPGQKAIIASGFSETSRVEKVQSLGAGAYIRKPLLLEKIGLAVKEELEK